MNATPAAPLISVILVCRNPGDSIREAWRSVISQTDASIEVIVIDGASTDGTFEWLQRMKSQFTRVLSEADNGVYTAMNKGVALARGTWLYFLGADDRLADNSVMAEIGATLACTDAGIVGGQARYADGRTYTFRGATHPVRRNFIHHQAAFYRRSCLLSAGSFDESLRVAADYDLNLRLWRSGNRFETVDRLISECGVGGLSDGGYWKAYREEIRVRHRFFSWKDSLIWDAATLVRFVRKQIIRRLRNA